MATWVLFFVVWGKFGTSSITVDFYSKDQCNSAKYQLATIVPSNKDGYYQYGKCFQK